MPLNNSNTDTGHPILNDPLYNHPAWQSTEGSDGGGACAGGGGDHTEGGRETGEAGESASKPCSSKHLESVVTEILRSKFQEAARRTGGAETVTGGGEMEEGERKGERTVTGGEMEEREGSDCSKSVESAQRTGNGTEPVARREPVASERRTEQGEGNVLREEGVKERTEKAKDEVQMMKDKEYREEVKKSDTREEREDAIMQREQRSGKPSEDSELEGKGTSALPEEENSYDPDCTECQLMRPLPSPEQLFMCLHALSYKV